jgi:hypothetical protein
VVRSAVSADLLKRGHEVLDTVEAEIAMGASLLRCQLLASDFYEDLQVELRNISDDDRVRFIAAVLDQCRRACDGNPCPDLMLSGLRRALIMLEGAREQSAPAAPAPSRPRLRVIQGGLAS